MKNQEFFAASWKNEIGAFKRVLEALPADKLDYTPHEKSRTARNLAWTIASEFNNVAGILETGNINANPAPAPATKEEIMKHFDTGVAALESRLSNITDERWNGPGKFIIAGNEVGAMPSSALAWLLHNDLIHHRGQLSTYIRPMGGKVPSIYGPSADTEMATHEDNV